nr:MAG: hypothetical protein [Microvirus sp.]
MLQTRYSLGKRFPEKNSGESLVETVGYVSTQKRIESMILAGQRLEQIKKQKYDFPDPKNINFDLYDHTRSKNYDMADAFQELEMVKQRQKERKEASQAAQEASQAAQEASNKVLKTEKVDDNTTVETKPV